jgi:hypothetical protein
MAEFVALARDNFIVEQVQSFHEQCIGREIVKLSLK